MNVNYELLQFYIYKHLVRRKDADKILEECKRLNVSVRDYLLAKEMITETTELEMPKDVTDDLTVVYNQMLDAVEGKCPLTITPQQALRVMRVMEAAFESHETNTVVKVEI